MPSEGQASQGRKPCLRVAVLCPNVWVCALVTMLETAISSDAQLAS